MAEPTSVPPLKQHFESVPRVELSGFEFLDITEERCAEVVVDACAKGIGGWMITPNLDILRKCAIDPSIRALCNRADVLVADGMPLIWASWLQGTPLPERVCGSDLITSLSKGCAAKGLKIYMLGGVPGAADGAAKVLKDQFPSLDIVGTYCPPFGFEKDKAEVARIADSVEKSQANLVFVAVGFPKSENLIDRIRDRLPNAWWVGVGISFSFLAGDVKRAPRWMQVTGTEWVFRLSQEPKRLARRYLIEDLPFVSQLLGSAVARRLGRS